MNNKRVLLYTSLLLGIGSFAGLPTVSAEPSSQAEIDQQRSRIQFEIEKVNEDISTFEEEIIALNEQITRVDQAIKDNNNMMGEIKQKIAKADDEVRALQEEINSLEVKIEQRYDLLKQRAVAFQKSGGSINYLDVLLGSKDFIDFINRVSIVTTLVEADAELLKQDQEDREELEVKQAKIEDKLAELNDMKAELDEIQAVVMDQKAQHEAMKEEVEEKKQASLDEKIDLKQQDSYLAAREAALKAASAPKVETMSFSSSQSYSGGDAVSTVVNAGRKYIGRSAYKWAGGRTSYDIANGLFDCSSFVRWAYAQAGIEVGWSTSALSQTGYRVNVDSMKPGDLVFFNTYKTNGHVGIYIGGGKFIGSQSSSGVEIENMSASYWKNTFSGHVRRVIN